MGQDIDINKLYENMLQINNTDSKILLNGEMVEYKFRLREGVTEEEIDLLRKQVTYPIPEDYLQFLKLTNGLRLNPDTYMNEISEVILISQIFKDRPRNIITVGIFWDDIHICIDLKSSQDNCMYVYEPTGDLDAYSLNCSFTKFLSRYINCCGAGFWYWGVNYEKKINASVQQMKEGEEEDYPYHYGDQEDNDDFDEISFLSMFSKEST